MCSIYSYLFMILVVIIYSANILVGKAINDVPPITITFFRILIAFLILFPIGYRSFMEKKEIFKRLRVPYFFMTITGVTFFNAFIYGALQFTSSANVAILETMIPVGTALISAWILKERLSKLHWVGVSLTVFGAMWIVMNGNIFQLGEIVWNIGDFIMIGAIVCWSIYSVMVKKYMHFLPPFGSLLGMTGLSVIILLPLMLIEWMIVGIPDVLHMDILIAFVFLGIFPSIIALILFNRAVEQLGASKASVFLNLLPVFTIAGAMIFLNEMITAMQIVGTSIVITGVLITTQLTKKRRK